MGIDDKTIQQIIQRILTVTQPDRVILFGSAATGSMTPDSDIDLLIVEPQSPDHAEEYVRIRRALHGIDYSFDIILISRQWFEESKDVIGGIAYPAHKYGKIIYDAA